MSEVGKSLFRAANLLMSTNPLNITNTDVRDHTHPKCFQVNMYKHLVDE